MNNYLRKKILIIFSASLIFNFQSVFTENHFEKKKTCKSGGNFNFIKNQNIEILDKNNQFDYFCQEFQEIVIFFKLIIR